MRDGLGPSPRPHTVKSLKPAVHRGPLEGVCARKNAKPAVHRGPLEGVCARKNAKNAKNSEKEPKEVKPAVHGVAVEGLCARGGETVGV